MKWTNEDGTMRIRTFDPRTGFYDISEVANIPAPEIDPESLPQKLDEYLSSGLFIAECLEYDDAYYTCTCQMDPCQCWMNVERENWVTALMEIGADHFGLYVANDADASGFSIPELFYDLGRDALARARFLGTPVE